MCTFPLKCGNNKPYGFLLYKWTSEKLLKFLRDDHSLWDEYSLKP